MKNLIILSLSVLLGSACFSVRAMEEITVKPDTPPLSPSLLRAMIEEDGRERVPQARARENIINNNNNVVLERDVEEVLPPFRRVPSPEEQASPAEKGPEDLVDEDLPQGSGWFMKNSTNAPLYLAWYRTQLHYIGSSDKERITEPITLEPQSSRFITFPPAGNRGYYSNRRELVVAQNRQQLATSLTSEASKELAVYSKGNLKEAYTRNKSRIVPVNFITPPGGAKLGIEHELAQEGWFFENRAERDVYCVWVSYGDTNKGRRRLMEGQSIGTIPSTEKVLIPLPARQGAGWLSSNSQRQLLFSFDRALLERIIAGDALTDDVLVRTKNEFGAYGTLCTILNENNVPLVSALTRVIRINNTTNANLYCALFLEDADGEMAYRCGGKFQEIYPHLGYILQLPEKNIKETIPGLKSNRSLCLLVSKDLQEDIFYRDQLSKTDRQGFFKKSFHKSNNYEWFINGEFDIIYDVKNPLKIDVVSHGGGAVQSFVQYIGDIRAPGESTVQEFEKRLGAQHPTFVPSETIRRAYQDQQYQIIHAQTKATEHFPLESSFLKARENLVRDAINEFLQDDEFKLAKDEEIPKVSLVFSGGGNRAKMGTIGFLRGADHRARGGNVLDCCMYATGLSGSTWALGSWVASGLRPKEFSDLQKLKVQDGLKEMHAKLIANESESYQERRFIQSRYNQSHGIIGVYGHTLGHAFLKNIILNGKNAHHITLSDLRTNLERHPEVFPLPIFVATDPGKEDALRTWLEFNPFYVGTNQDGGSWIDAELFGCTFENGRVVHAVPEYPLAHCFGVWGSAFALDSDDIKKVYSLLGTIAQGASVLGGLGGLLYDAILRMPKKSSENHGRLAAGSFPNYLYQSDRTYPDLAAQETLHLIDGGITKEGEHRHNFASVPALWREADVLIMCDAIDKPNSDAKVEHLSASEEEAGHLKLPFPCVARGNEGKKRQEQINRDVSSLIVDERAPLVVYMKPKRNQAFDAKLQTHDDLYLREHGYDPDVDVPFRGESNFTDTLNFGYNVEQFDLLSGLTEEIMIQSKDTIREALKEAIRRKRELRDKK